MRNIRNARQRFVERAGGRFQSAWALLKKFDHNNCDGTHHELRPSLLRNPSVFGVGHSALVTLVTLVTLHRRRQD
jgi:hypothetical protein